MAGTTGEDETSKRTDPPFAALAVTPGGEVWDYRVIPDRNGRVTTTAVLEMLYERIDCRTIAVVRLTPKISMWLDEEGAMKPKLRVNQLASYIAARLGFAFELFVGVVMFTGAVDRRGSMEPLSDEARETIASLVAELRSIPGS